MDFVDEETFHFFESGEQQDFNGCNLDFLALLSRSYLFKSQQEEERTLIKLYGKYVQQMEGHKVFFLCPTYDCNLACVYCFENKSTQHGRIMNNKVLRRALNLINILTEHDKDKHTHFVVIFGGEPLLRRPKQIEIVCQILAECEERGYASKITTNGGVPVHLRVNIDSSNVDSLPQLFQFIQAKGWIDTGNLLPYLAPLQLKEGCYEGEDSLDILLNRVFEIYRKHKETEIFDAFEFQPVFLIKQFFKSGGILPMQFKQCGANHGQYLLDLYGDISLCLGACGAKEYAVGSFYPKLYIDEEKLAAWRNRSMLTIPKCKECKFGPICGGGCSLKALENTGTLAAPHCPPIESMMRLALEYYFPVLRAMAVVH